MNVDKIVYYWTVGLVIIIVLFIIGVATYFFLKKTNRLNRTKENEKNYQKTKRKNSKDFLDEFDIRNDMISNKEFTNFTMGIRVYGFDYFTTDAEERYQIISNYIGLLNSLDSKIQFYIKCRSVDIDHYVDTYNLQIKNKESLLLQKEEELSNLRVTSKDNLDEETRLIVEEKIDEVLTEIENIKWSIEHLLQTIGTMRALSDNKEQPYREEYYFFNYEYVKSDFNVELTQNEILKRAYDNLISKINNACSILTGCKVKTEILKGDDLLYIMRKHYNPYSADEYKISDIKNSTFYNRLVTSDSLKEAEKDMMKEVFSKQLWEDDQSA